MGQLDGQVAIITGGGTGIGRATRQPSRAKAAAVALVGRRREPLDEAVDELTAAGLAATALPADVADRSAGRAVVQSVTDAWGRLDVLVNNAGLNVPQRDMASVTAEDWTTVVEVNLTGTFLFTQAALPQMRQQRSGTVINVSSMAGHRASALTGPAYSAAKAGVLSFTESLNLTERAHGVRACAVCPGEVATPILDARPQPPSAQARAAMLQPEDLAQTFLLVVTLPHRATIELLTIYPTVQRDWTAEVGSA
jgi:NADP-dependent 3-hydroxy acid dehydrogenase YdfG